MCSFSLQRFTRLWLLVILTVAISGYPTKKDPVGSSSRKPFGSSREEPGHAESAPKRAARLHTDEQPRSLRPSAQMRPAPALHESSAYPPPGYQGFVGGAPVGSTQPRFQSPPNQVQWAVAPPTPFSGRPFSPGEQRFVSEGPGYMSPSAPLPPFQPADASYEERTYEEGDSESEDQGPPAQYLPAMPLSELSIGNPLALGALIDRLRYGYPLMEYLLLSRRYPPGTYTLSTDQLDHRKNQWHDSRHIGDPYMSGRKQLGPVYPYSKKHRSRPVKQSPRDAAGHGID